MTISFDISAFGNLVALQGGEVWTPGQVAAACAARMDELRGAGLAKGDWVTISHGDTPGFFADLFAVWQVGGAAACLNPGAVASEVRNAMAFVGSSINLDEPLPRPDADASPSPHIESSPDDAALILFTSGTTGDPKGVVHTFRSLAQRIELNHKHMPKDVLRRTLCVLPTYFGHGLIGNALTPLLAGGEVILAAGGGIMTAAKLGPIIDEHGITFMSSVPSFWKMALKAAARPTGTTLKRIHIGSAPVSAELVHAVQEWSGGATVVNMYGITETANWIAGSSTDDRTPEDGLIGTMWGGEAVVLTDKGERKTSGHGELLVRTPSLMQGYFARDDLTRAVMQEGWYHTGDTGHIDEAGLIRLTGRIKNEINRGGMKVAPEEVDLLLEQHPDVDEACAFGLPDPIAGETVAVAIKPASAPPPSSEDLRMWCLTRIRRHCVPERWFIVDEIPKTPRGKVNRADVRAACLAGERE